jgi:hypothetical protein
MKKKRRGSFFLPLSLRRHQPPTRQTLFIVIAGCRTDVEVGALREVANGLKENVVALRHVHDAILERHQVVHAKLESRRGK